MNAFRLRERMGDEEWAQGRALYRRGAMREMSRSPEKLQYAVAGAHCVVTIFADGRIACDCPLSPLCRHAAAALIAAGESGAMRFMQEARASARAQALLSVMEGALPECTYIRMEPEIRLDGAQSRIGLRIGQDRLYVVRAIPELLACIAQNKPLPLGKGFTFSPGWMRFPPEAERLLDVLRVHCETLEDADINIGVQQSRLMSLPGSALTRTLDLLTGMRFRMQAFGQTLAQEGIPTEALPLSFTLSDRARAGEDKHRLCVSAMVEGDVRPLTAMCEYALSDGRVMRVPKAQRGVARLLLGERGGKAAFLFEPNQTQKVMGELTLWLSRVGELRFSPELAGQLIRYPFRARVYLDRDGADVTARTEFIYGEHVIDPFAPSDENGGQLLLRDAQREQEVTDILAGAGFRVARGRVYLTSNDDIYRFVTGGAGALTQYAEVFFSNDFKRLTPRRPALAGALRASGGQLRLDMTDEGEDIEELLPLMRALRDRALYFRYKDGAFISLEEQENWRPLAQAVCEAAEYQDVRDLGLYRAAYMDALIRAGDLPLAMDATTARAAHMEATPAAPPVDCLRPYQERGFLWLCALHELGMGGILADDMGLGKTVQTIAAILHFVRSSPERKPSVIVSPTSLTYNWLSEFRRFAPELKVLLLSGSQSARATQLERFAGGDAPDVLLTSYPLVRRDAPLLAGIRFRFAVLDEAQHIKNAASVGAHAVKQLSADTRVALTGTPMENHAGELWSIFDFILPGYLPRAGAFMRRYGEGEHSEELMRRIRPFLMRRLKKDVLTELPDKLEITLMAEMTAEQRQAYRAGMLRRREHVQQILATRGMARGRAEVLSAITELRQICCHPALCLPQYTGASGKLEMLVDVLLPALLAGRRALVFSQFTRMLRLIEKRLMQEGVHSLYLDGDTPADERVRLCESFNAGMGSVFLLSLKAGGTGLNLTGADMVIHYDPWWNPAAEEQAVDRAHRIGQTKEVEVVRLLVHDSIEEQVVGMSRQKRKLFDLLITPGESMPTRLSDSDILKLFQGD